MKKEPKYRCMGSPKLITEIEEKHPRTIKKTYNQKNYALITVETMQDIFGTTQFTAIMAGLNKRREFIFEWKDFWFVTIQRMCGSNPQ